MPWIPHWYVVRDRDVGRETFKELVRMIWAGGRVGHWGVQPRVTHLENGTIVDGLIYYERGEWRYWTMGYPIDTETVINRERVDRKGIRWAEEEPVQGTLFDEISLPGPTTPDWLTIMGERLAGRGPGAVFVWSVKCVCAIRRS